MNNVDKQYKELIKKILTTGISKRDRTGVGTISIFGHQMRFDMGDGFPLLTLRKIHVKSVIHELLWFLGAFDQDKYGKFGNTNIRPLIDVGVTFWTEWPYKKYMESRKYRPELPEFTMKEFEQKILLDDDFAIEFGSIGPGYGKQWIDFGGWIEKTRVENRFDLTVHQGFNQIDYLINELKKNPDSRRLVLNSWKADEIDDMLLPPCHLMFQLYSEKMSSDDRIHSYTKWLINNNLPIKPMMDEYNFPDRRLSMMLTIRSNDFALGNPYNVAEYALLLHMIAQVVNMVPFELIVNIGDTHIYNNHIEQMKKLLERNSYDLPKLVLNRNIKNIYDFRYDDIKIENYMSHSNLKMEVAV